MACRVLSVPHKRLQRSFMFLSVPENIHIPTACLEVEGLSTHVIEDVSNMICIEHMCQGRLPSTLQHETSVLYVLSNEICWLKDKDAFFLYNTLPLPLTPQPKNHVVSVSPKLATKPFMFLSVLENVRHILHVSRSRTIWPWSRSFSDYGGYVLAHTLY